MNEIAEKLREFIENEGKSCSFDPALIMLEYVFRMCGGQVPLNEIEKALKIQDSRFMF